MSAGLILSETTVPSPSTAAALDLGDLNAWGCIFSSGTVVSANPWILLDVDSLRKEWCTITASDPVEPFNCPQVYGKECWTYGPDGEEIHNINPNFAILLAEECFQDLPASESTPVDDDSEVILIPIALAATSVESNSAPTHVSAGPNWIELTADSDEEVDEVPVVQAAPLLGFIDDEDEDY